MHLTYSPRISVTWTNTKKRKTKLEILEPRLPHDLNFLAAVSSSATKRYFYLRLLSLLPLEVII